MVSSRSPYTNRDRSNRRDRRARAALVVLYIHLAMLSVAMFIMGCVSVIFWSSTTKLRTALALMVCDIFTFIYCVTHLAVRQSKPSSALVSVRVDLVVLTAFLVWNAATLPFMLSMATVTKTGFILVILLFELIYMLVHHRHGWRRRFAMPYDFAKPECTAANRDWRADVVRIALLVYLLGASVTAFVWGVMEYVMGNYYDGLSKLIVLLVCEVLVVIYTLAAIIVRPTCPRTGIAVWLEVAILGPLGIWALVGGILLASHPIEFDFDWADRRSPAIFSWSICFWILLILLFEVIYTLVHHRDGWRRRFAEHYHPFTRDCPAAPLQSISAPQMLSSSFALTGKREDGLDSFPSSTTRLNYV